MDRQFRTADLSEAGTVAEIEAILGPPGNYSTRPNLGYQTMNMGIVRERPDWRPVEWEDDFARVVVYFAPDGRACRVEVWGVVPDDRTWVERVRDLAP